jgi:hypothetical protein
MEDAMINVQDRQFDAYQSFLLGCKLHWTGTIFPELHALYAEKAERATNAGSTIASVAFECMNR